MKLKNSPSKGFPLEVAFAPAIAVSRYENGGPVTHLAKREFADSFIQNYDFKDFANSKICKSLRRSRFLEVPKHLF